MSFLSWAEWQSVLERASRRPPGPEPRHEQRWARGGSQQQPGDHSDHQQLQPHAGPRSGPGSGLGGHAHHIRYEPSAAGSLEFSRANSAPDKNNKQAWTKKKKQKHSRQSGFFVCFVFIFISFLSQNTLVGNERINPSLVFSTVFASQNWMKSNRNGVLSCFFSLLIFSTHLWCSSLAFSYLEGIYLLSMKWKHLSPVSVPSSWR